MSCLRVVRAVALLSLLLAVSFQASLPARPASAKNSVHVDQRNKIITVTVNLTVIEVAPAEEDAPAG